MARIGLAVAGLGAAALLTACGGGNDFADGSADSIVKSAKSDMGDLKSVKVSGTISSGGDDISIDMQSSSDGSCTGSIGAGGGKAEILGVKGDTWMRPDESFWRSFAGSSADQVIAAVGDKWVAIPSTEESFNQFCDVDKLLDQLLKDGSSKSTYAKKGTAEVDGDEVVKIDNTEDGETSTGYVLTDDPHYLVKIEKAQGSDTGTVTFSEFNKDFDVEAPAKDEVVDLNSIAG